MSTVQATIGGSAYLSQGCISISWCGIFVIVPCGKWNSTVFGIARYLLLHGIWYCMVFGIAWYLVFHGVGAMSGRG